MTETGKQVAERSTIDPQYQWHTDLLYTDEQDWQADFAAIKALLDQADRYAGHLHEGPQIFLDFLRYQDQLSGLIDKVYLYAALKRDEDNRVARYQGMREQIEGLAVAAGAKLAFFSPEVLALDEALLAGYLQNPEISLYQKMIDDILRQKPHTLPPAQEKLLAEVGEMAGSFDTIYSMLCDADFEFPAVVNEEGQPEQLSHGNYIRLLQCGDRQVREAAFKAMYGTYGKFANTIAATFGASIKKDAFYAKTRNYPSALAASLDGDNIPLNVYHQLVKTVRRHLPLYYRYLELRRRMLKLDQLHMYDIYVPLLAENERKYDYAEAKQIVLKALAPLGTNYTQTLAKGFESGWVDVYENKGKTSGAYSSGVYGSAPYMLLNYQDNLNSVFTLAHEAGHSMHSYHTWQTQPYIYGNYRIFVAEVASTVNENLLVDHLLAKAESKGEIFSLLNHFMEEFRGTVFRQTMFAEFELEAHKLADAGEALTAERLNALYYQLNKDYFGPEMVVDEEIAREWMRIPHFYRAFYVYKYSTGFCAAMALSAALTDPDPAQAAAAQKRYLNFLSSGSSADPIDLLKGAGVDMSSPEPIEQAMATFEKMLKRMEDLV